MDNYEYIIASLPAISREWKFPDGVSWKSILGEIREQCSAKDNSLIGKLLDGFKESNLDKDFYTSALASGNRFIREYFRFDLAVRNAKVRFLNKALGRPESQDTMELGEAAPEETAKIEAAFRGNDILERERAIDALMWEKISAVTIFDYFNIEAVLGFIAKLRIIDRWFSLDETTGREMFGKLVEEVRGSFKGVEYDPDSEDA